MRELFILIADLLVTLAKLAKLGALGTVAGESVAVKHQLLIMKRAQRRAPKLTAWDRLVLGVCALFVAPRLSFRASDIPFFRFVLHFSTTDFTRAQRFISLEPSPLHLTDSW